MQQTPITAKWNLDELYTGMQDPQIEADFTRSNDYVNEFETNYRGKIAELSSADLLELLRKSEAMGNLLNRLDLYAFLLEVTNIGNAEITRFQKQIDERITQISTRVVFLDVELAKIPEAKWQEHLHAEVLQPYAKYLAEQYRAAKHTLSEPEEKILIEKSQTGWQTLTHLFKITTDTLTLDWNGKQITLSEALVYIRDPEAAIRKKAALAIAEALKTNTKTTPAIYNALIHDKSISDRLRKYDYPEAGRFESDDVEKPVVDALVTAVNESSSIVARYYALKKQILNLDTLYWWDRYAPLPQPKTEINAEQAQTMVLEAFADFSPEVHDIAKRMFDEAHIDWFPSQTKRGGAFCAMGDVGKLPYVLLNHTNDINDVMTLAHELGHAIHDVLADENNNRMQAHPSLALAEIASTFGEMIMFDRLMAGELSKKDKIALLMNAVEDNIATIHRQISMFTFEQSVHTKRRTEGELAKEQLDDLWHDAIRKPFGDSVIWTDEHKSYWMYIPHIFNTPFYVYSYAFAQLCTLALYEQYKTEGTSFVPKYLEILKAGGSLSPKDNLARAGLDITNPDFWQLGLKPIENYINQLELLLSD